VEEVYALPSITINNLIVKTIQRPSTGQAPTTGKQAYRLEYKTMDQYVEFAQLLNIMADSKAGVPRTAYRGIVTCFINGIRIYLSMPKNVWREYNRKWEAPAEALAESK